MYPHKLSNQEVTNYVILLNFASMKDYWTLHLVYNQVQDFFVLIFSIQHNLYNLLEDNGKMAQKVLLKMNLDDARKNIVHK